MLKNNKTLFYLICFYRKVNEFNEIFIKFHQRLLLLILNLLIFLSIISYINIECNFTISLIYQKMINRWNDIQSGWWINKTLISWNLAKKNDKKIKTIKKYLSKCSLFSYNSFLNANFPTNTARNLEYIENKKCISASYIYYHRYRLLKQDRNLVNIM